MSTISNEALNQAAMQIIMLAGDGRNLLNEAMNDTISGAPAEAVDGKLGMAKDKLVKAHRIQTDMIQSSIDDDDLKTTLLFSHAQDTLMTINTEQNLIGHMINLCRTLTRQPETGR